MRSVLVPGWGQLSTRQRLVGKVLVFITGLAAIAALTVFLFVEPIEIAAWLVDPDVILGVVLVNLAILVIRLFSTEHAWRSRGGHRLFAGVFLAAIVAIPHVAIAWVGLETRDSLTRVFAGEETPPAPSSTSTTTTIPTTTTTTPIELSPVTTLPGQLADDSVPDEAAPPWEPFGRERLNILLLGGDAGPGRSGLRTDTMMIVSIDPISGDVALIGVPRNYGKVTLKDGSAVPVTQVGHVYGWGRKNPDAFPGTDPGAEAVVEVIENISGLEIDYYALVDLTGFADVVDVFGGVRLVVPEPVDGPLYDEETGGYEMVHIPAGPQHLDGGHALAYSRARYGSSDYARMARQRCVLANMAAQADMLELLARMGTILDVVASNIVTDMGPDVIPDLVRLTPRVDTSKIRAIGFDATWASGRTLDGHPIPDIARIREAVAATISGDAGSAAFGAVTAEAGC